ncbi:MAG: M61 family metallopeptidase, partial [Planctomycetota bacterium]
ADWRVAGGLDPLPGLPRTLRASNYDELGYSPLEIGQHERLEFEVDGTPHEIVIWGNVEFDGDRLIEDFTSIVREQAAIFGRMPYERYVFLVHAGAGVGGGTEHLNSTIMQTSRGALEGSIDQSSAYQRFLGLVSHEMFHTWNVKQFRPAGIHPYDYQRENYSRLFWVAEGTTSYYDDLTLVRVELVEPEKYLDRLAGSIESFRSRPG